MFYFAIPLRAKSTATNWNEVCLRLEHTILSIKESCSQYKIFIACHDMPDFLGRWVDDIEFISVAHSIPTSKNQYMADKNSKKSAARRRILDVASEGDYFMYLDADDLLSVEFEKIINNVFSRNKDVDDIALYSGYAYDVARKKIAYLNGVDKIFYRNCGSCFISKINKIDMVLEKREESFLASLVDHTKYPESSIRFSRSIIANKDPVMCYVVNHGSNDAAERHGSDVITRFIDQYECKNDEKNRLFFKNFNLENLNLIS